MFQLEKMRLPFRQDKLFSVLMFTVFVVPLAFTWYSYEKYETIKISLLLILLGWASLIVVAKFFSKQLTTLAVHKPALYIAGLLSGWIVLSTVRGVNLLNGLFGVHPRFTSGAVFYISLIIFFILLLSSLTKEKFEFLLKVLVLDAAIVSVVGIMQSMGVAFYQGLDVVGFQRSPSLLGNADFSSMFVVGILPIVLYFAVTVSKFWEKIYYYVVACAIIIATIVFSSRGAWLGCVAVLIFGALVAAIIRAPKKILIVHLLALVVGATLWYVALPHTRPGTVAQTITLSESNIDSRLYAWDIARQAIEEHPVVGVGPGNFQYYFQAHRGKNMADLAGVFDDVHNLFLQLAASLGVPFLLLFLIVLTVSCVSGLRKAYLTKDFMPVALVAGLVGLCLMACFTPVASACFIAIAVLLAGLVLPQARFMDVSGLKVPGIFLSLVGLILIIVGTCFLTSELLLYRGYIQYYANNYKKADRTLRVAGYFNPWSQLIQIYDTAAQVQLGMPQEEVQSKIKKFIALYPQDVRGYLAAANIDFLLYDRTGDITQLQKTPDLMLAVIKLDPNNAVRYSGTALYYYALNKLPEALAYDTYSLSLSQNNIPGWILLAKIYQLQGNVKASKAAIAKVYGMRPDLDLLRAIYESSKNLDAEQYKKVVIPVLYNPNQVE